MGLGGLRVGDDAAGASRCRSIRSPRARRSARSLNQQCVTPCTLTVQRKDEFSVSFAKPGYQPQTIQVDDALRQRWRRRLRRQYPARRRHRHGCRCRERRRRSSTIQIRFSPCCSRWLRRPVRRSRVNAAAAMRLPSRNGRRRRQSSRRLPTCRRRTGAAAERSRPHDADAQLANAAPRCGFAQRVMLTHATVCCAHRSRARKAAFSSRNALFSARERPMNEAFGVA